MRKAALTYATAAAARYSLKEIFLKARQKLDPTEEMYQLVIMMENIHIINTLINMTMSGTLLRCTLLCHHRQRSKVWST